MIFVLFGILTVGMVGFVLYTGIMTDSLLGDYDFASSKLAIHKVAEIVKQRTGNFYDLGSARGNFLLKLVKLVPSMDYYGLDNSLFRIWASRLKAFLLNKNITFLHKNILTEDSAKIDTAYVYLEASLMPSLEKKLMTELKPGAMVITNTNPFPNWQLQATFVTHPKNPEKEKLFMYIKQ